LGRTTKNKFSTYCVTSVTKYAIEGGFVLASAAAQGIVTSAIADPIAGSIDIVDKKKYQGLKYRLHDKIKGNKVIHDHIFRNKLFKTRSESENISEELRKQIKKTIKHLRKENGFLLIDRNLVKMKDAKKKIAPAIQQLLSVSPNVAPNPQSKKSFFHVGPHFSDSNEKKVEVADQALRAVAETTYYAEKISGVVSEIQTTLANLMSTLGKLDDEVIQLKEILREPITTILTDDPDSKFYV